MKVDIQVTGLDITPSLKEYIELKIGSLEKFLTRFAEKSTLYTKVEIARTTRHHKHGKVFYAEANLHIPGKIFRAECKTSNARAAIDRVKDKLQREIRKYKTTH